LVSELVLSREQVRSIDRMAIEELGMPGVVLMENAGRGCAELLLKTGVIGPVCICCGKGNNGGDGFVIARHLENHGISTDVLLFTDPDELTGDAAVNYGILERSRASIHVLLSVGTNPNRLNDLLMKAEWIVDALLGTGTTGEVRDPFATAIDSINQAGKSVLAVDIPSGLDCDTGETLGHCVRATMTATFVARKPGFQNAAAGPFLGQVHVVDIGVPHFVLTKIHQG